MISNILLLLAIGMALYVFEIFPFNPGGPIVPPEQHGVSRNGEDTTNPEELPDFLQEGVTRTKTYDEHMTRGNLLVQNGYNALAVAEFEAAADQAPTNPSPLIAIGKIHLDSGDTIKAKLSFEEALKLNPSNLEATIYLGKTLIQDREVAEAKILFDGISVHNQLSKFYQAMTHAYVGDHEGAKTAFRESINIGGDQNITAGAQNFLSAYDEFDANQGGPAVHLYTLLARSYDQVGEYEMAIPVLFEVIREKKDYRDAWIILGHSYLSTQKYQDAVEALEEARKLDPQKPETLFFLGLGYFGLEDYEQAAAFLELAKSNGFQPQVQVDQKLAEIYLILEDYEAATDKYEEVLSLNSQEINYFIKPMWVYIEKLNQPEKAVTLANLALQTHPDQAMSYNLLGWAKIATGDLVEAKQDLEKAASLDPELDAVYLNFGTLYQRRGDNQTALAFYKKAYELGGGNSISTAAADMYNKLIGNSDQFDYSSLKVDLLSQ
ncbi:MAG: tetratricopeptide repeat protein [Candidatus Gracilibacteria bacterium]